MATLQHELTHNRVAHAYLFSGPRGVGKTTTARLLAMAVNTKDIRGEQRERTVADILSGKSIDVIEIDAASHTGVDNVRENIIENARFTPQQLPYKVFIIDEVHMLSSSAFNALLKTLEEPPAHVIFILATTEIHRVPETIISRCQRFDFKRVGIPELVARLEKLAAAEKVHVEPEILQAVARRADGSVRDAEVLLGQLLSLGAKNITAEQASLVLPRSNIQSVVQLFLALAARDARQGILIVHQLMDDGVHLQDFTKELIEFLRTTLLARAHAFDDELNAYGLAPDQRQQVQGILESMSVPQLLHIIETFVVAEKALRSSTIPQLPLELAIVTVAHADDTDEQHPDVPPPPAEPPTTPERPAPSSRPRPKNDDTTVHRTTSDGSLEAIVQQWPTIVDTVSTTHRSIAMSLKVGVPYKRTNDTLTIAFQHAFHAERIAQPTVRAALQDIIATLTGLTVHISTVVLEPDEFDKAQPAGTGDDAVRDALEVFGSEAVAED